MKKKQGDVKGTLNGKNEGNRRLCGGNVFARIPSHTDGDGFMRIFVDAGSVEDGGKMIPMLDGSMGIELQQKMMAFETTSNRLVIDVPGMKMPVERMAWIYVPQPAYRPGSVIKGFIVARERLNPHVMAMRKSRVTGGQVRLSKQEGGIVMSRPVDLTTVVQEFELDLSGKDFMATGNHRIDVLDENGKVMGSANVAIDHFEKKEIAVTVASVPWILHGDVLEIPVEGKYYHGEMVTSGTISVWKEGADRAIETRRVDPEGTTVFKIDGLEAGQHSFVITLIDDQGREESTTFPIIVSDVPALFKVTVPGKTVYSTLPVTIVAKLESPDGLPVSFVPAIVTWRRVGKIAIEEMEKRAVETGVNGYITIEKTLDHDGSYEFTIDADVDGERVSVTKTIPVKRFDPGVVAIRNEINGKRCFEGDRIRGKATIHAAPETIAGITFGYIDLVTDKIVETRRVEIRGKEVEYEFNGVMDFWGTAAVDFYINTRKVNVEIHDSGETDKAGCIHAIATIVVEPKIPIEIKATIDAVRSATTGEEITLRVTMDPGLLEEHIHVFGALVDTRVSVIHDDAMKGTFLKAPKPLEVMVLEGMPISVASIQSYRGSSFFAPIGSAMPEEFRSRSTWNVSIDNSNAYSCETSFLFSPKSSVNCFADQLAARSTGSHDNRWQEIKSCVEIPNIVFPGNRGNVEMVTRENFAESVPISPVEAIDGEAMIKVKLPDAVTIFDIMIFVAGTTRFGSVSRSIIVKNPVFTHVLNPSMMTLESDRVYMRAIVQNTTGSVIKNVEASLRAIENLKVHGNVVKRIDVVPADDARFVEWEVTGSGVGNARFVVDVKTSRFIDRAGVDQPLFVKPPGEPVVERMNMLVTKERPARIKWNLDGSEAFAIGKITILPSMDVAILDGMEALAQYPYGCMEQTCSSTLPNVVALEYLEATGKLTVTLREKLVHNMQSGFERMMGYRNLDGGFSYWGRESTPFYTALGIYVISRMKPHLSGVPGDLFTSALSYLEMQKNGRCWSSMTGHAATTPRLVSDEATTAYVINCLASAGIADDDAFSWISSTIERVKEDPVILSLVLDSWGRVEKYRAAFPGMGKQIKDWLLASVVRDGDSMHWKAGSSFTGQVESTARVAIALIAAFPGDAIIIPALQDVTRFLLSTRTGNGWSSTMDTLLASTAISMIAQIKSTDFTIDVKLGGKLVKQEKVTRDTIAWKVHDLHGIEIGGLDNGINDIEISMDGEGTCHVTTEIERYYHGAVPRAGNGKLSIQSRLSTSKVTVGDKVDMIVAVEPGSSPSESLMVRVPLPPLFRFDGNKAMEPGNGMDKVMVGKDAIHVFNRSVTGRMEMHVPLEATFPGECRIDASAFEMYSGIAAVASPIIIPVTSK